MVSEVDLVVLTRDEGPLRPEVDAGIRQQRGVKLVLHRVIGTPRPTDRNRLETIVRARNEAKRLGASPWLMFVDDDVALDAGCARTLLDELGRRPVFGALAADYLNQGRRGRIATHIGMGATLFRREALDQIRFRWEGRHCECQCCCADLRQLHWGIDYSAAARATHLKEPGNGAASCSHTAASGSVTSKATGLVLAALNGKHLEAFQHQFLRSLRGAGNNEPVLALAMGFSASQQRALLGYSRVKAFFRPDNGRFVGRQRLKAFQEILSGLPPATIVAYWDAGDVVFQAPLDPLWELVAEARGKILAAREPSGHPDNPVVAAWTESIRDPLARREARKLLYHHPFLNSGFVAGTAESLLRYCRTVTQWYQRSKLFGTWNPGDQMALNIYCHSQPGIWQEAPEGWNYCLCRRNRDTFYRDDRGRFVDVRGVPIHVVHGNAHTLRRFAPPAPVQL